MFEEGRDGEPGWTSVIQSVAAKEAAEGSRPSLRVRA